MIILIMIIIVIIIVIIKILNNINNNNNIMMTLQLTLLFTPICTNRIVFYGSEILFKIFLSTENFWTHLLIAYYHLFIFASSHDTILFECIHIFCQVCVFEKVRMYVYGTECMYLNVCVCVSTYACMRLNA